MSATLLVVHHSPAESVERMRRAFVDGARDDAIDGVEVVVRHAPEADADDVLGADLVVVVTTENFGSMAGLVKDFFERIYHPCLDRTQGRPYALLVKAGEDGQGAIRAVESIATGLRWRRVREPLLVVGDLHGDALDRCVELGQTLAAGLSVGAL